VLLTFLQARLRGLCWDVGRYSAPMLYLGARSLTGAVSPLLHDKVSGRYVSDSGIGFMPIYLTTERNVAIVKRLHGFTHAIYTNLVV
jgi:hypothetical protein